MRKDLLRFSGAEVPIVAVVAGRSGDGTHAGILYAIGGVVHILHQRWDYLLERTPFLGPGQPAEETFTRGYAYAVPNLVDEKQFLVVRWCQLVAKRYVEEKKSNGIPFAFVPDDGERFAAIGMSNEGEFVITEDGKGLTCSLFVLAMFSSAKAPLVKIETWDRRHADDVRHATLMRQLRAFHSPESASPEHLAAVEGQLPCVRVRPEETVAACIQEEIPASFRPTWESGDWILRVLDFPACLKF